MPGIVADREAQVRTVQRRLDLRRGKSGAWFAQVDEVDGEDNNVAYDTDPMEVTFVAAVDLAVAAVTDAPTNVVPGQDTMISLTAENLSDHVAYGPWHDSVYLSADDQWDPHDALFALDPDA